MKPEKGALSHMSLILMIAAGILLAVLLLPFLGTILMAGLSVAYYIVIILLVCAGVVLLPFIIRGIFTVIGAVLAIFGLTKEAPAGAQKLTNEIRAARAQTLMGQVRAAPEFARGLAAGQGLGELAGLRGPGRLWYRHLLRERFNNCGHAGLFRVEDGLNRAHLERLLARAARRCAPGDAEQARELCQTALSCHDSLCKRYPPKKR